jgi:2-keto-3-deoxy-L-fuconate dehydrogenase
MHGGADGLELAEHNVRVYAIAQNFLDNPANFPPEVQDNQRLRERLAIAAVPVGRGTARRHFAPQRSSLRRSVSDGR